uniref:Uncharacterized protein n=1 Tax=Lutzomyia longipalpis TaxID=7200 RepID=A0A1B0CA10_LUTLO
GARGLILVVRDWRSVNAERVDVDGCAVRDCSSTNDNRMLPSEMTGEAWGRDAAGNDWGENQFPDIGSRCAPLRAIDIYHRLGNMMRVKSTTRDQHREGAMRAQLLNAAFLGCTLKYNLNAPKE